MVDRYDAGLLNDFGGGNVEWWQDYLRAELERAHDFYADQIEAAERLARVVTDARANAMLEFVHSKKASTLTNTEMFRQGIELALAEPAGEAEPYETPIAAEDGREVDWVDVTGWGVFKGHAIPVDVARYIATKINLYAEQRTTPPDASAIREALEAARSALINIAHTFTEDSHGGTKPLPASEYQDIAREALAALAGGAKP